MKIIKRLVLVCVFMLGAVVVLVVLGTVVPNGLVYREPGDASLSRRILVVANTIHTDIAIPIDDLSLAALGFLEHSGQQPIRHPDARWLLIGWGGRSFYLQTPTLADIKPGPAFRALTIDSSVMHVDVLAEILETDPMVLPLSISEGEYANLLATISASFTRKSGQVQPIEGYAFGAVDRFYEAQGSFNALLGCNIWSSRVLRSAGLSTGMWNAVPGSLTTSLRLFNSANLAPPVAAPGAIPAPAQS